MSPPPGRRRSGRSRSHGRDCLPHRPPPLGPITQHRHSTTTAPSLRLRPSGLRLPASASASAFGRARLATPRFGPPRRRPRGAVPPSSALPRRAQTTASSVSAVTAPNECLLQSRPKHLALDKALLAAKPPVTRSSWTRLNVLRSAVIGVGSDLHNGDTRLQPTATSGMLTRVALWDNNRPALASGRAPTNQINTSGVKGTSILDAICTSLPRCRWPPAAKSTPLCGLRHRCPSHWNLRTPFLGWGQDPPIQTGVLRHVLQQGGGSARGHSLRVRTPSIPTPIPPDWTAPHECRIADKKHRRGGLQPIRL